MTDANTGKSFVASCHANNCKAIKCLGGAGTGPTFTSQTNSGNLAGYVSGVVSAMQSQGYDGLDLDWEEGINDAQYLALSAAIRAALDKITPRPLFTVATADYFAGSTVPAAAYFDQINLMSYWTDVNGMAGELNSFTSKGVAKTKLGVGYGYDTDNETDVNNPNDVGAKCLYAINNGYGGVMVWEIDRACTKCDDTTAYYVNKNAVVPVMPMLSGLTQNGQRVLFSVSNGTGIGVSEIRYSVPSSQVVNLSLFNMKGALVQNLANGMQVPGNYVIPVGRYTSRTRVSPGVYVAKMASPASTESGMVVVK